MATHCRSDSKTAKNQRTMLSISLYTIWGGMQVIEGDLDLPLYVSWMLSFDTGEVWGSRFGVLFHGGKNDLFGCSLGLRRDQLALIHSLIEIIYIHTRLYIYIYTRLKKFI